MPKLNLKERLQNHLTHLARERDPYLATGGHFYVQQYIRQQLEKWGPVEMHEFKVRGATYQNLVLNLPHHLFSSNPQKALILIGAHYDAVPGSPGADDNATGIAVLLELARLLSSSQDTSLATKSTKHPVRLVAFDLEEFGMLGSSQYAAELQQLQQPVRLMISLEMLGYKDSTSGSQRSPLLLKYLFSNRGDFISLVGNWLTIPDLIGLSRNIRQTGVPCKWLPAGQRGFILPETRRSDHAPFWDCGYRALMVTDTAHLRNPNYHKASDRVETLDLDFLTAVCRGLAKGIRCL